MELLFFTKFLKGLTAVQVGEQVRRLGFDGLDLAVRAGQSVNPDNITQALPNAMCLWADMGLSVRLASLDMTLASLWTRDRRSFPVCDLVP